MPSVQGYSSTVDGRYAAATGSHEVSGGGQDTLSPSAVSDGTLDQLSTSVLLTPAEYLVTSGTGGPAAGPPGTGRRQVAAGQQAAWYLGGTIDVTRIEIRDASAARDAATGVQLGITSPDGTTRWWRAQATGPATLGLTLTAPAAALAVQVRAPQAGLQASLGAPSLTAAGGGVAVADGQLQDAVAPSHWRFAGFDGSFAVFANQQARPALSLRARPGGSLAGASVTGSGGAPAEPATVRVSSPGGVRVVRAVADIPGWTATWRPSHGSPASLAVQRDGLVQAVNVPAGSGVVTWSYTPPGLEAGLALSLAAAAALLSCLAAPAAGRARRRLRGGPGRTRLSPR